MASSNALKCVVSCFGSMPHNSPQGAVKRYIEEQQGKDVFEYNVYGNPQQKIGDFIQQKLTGWPQC